MLRDIPARPPFAAPTKPMARRTVALGMMLVLLVAAAIRLPGLPMKDISFIDEGSQLQEGRFLASVAAAALGRLGIPWQPGGDPEFASVEGLQFPTRWGELRGEPLLSARLLHSAFLGLAMLLLGERPLAGQMVSALSGIATVALAFSIGRRLYGPAVGLAAAAALAVSGWHAIYSTQAWPRRTPSSYLPSRSAPSWLMIASVSC